MLVVSLALEGCKDESQPVDVPFDGVEPVLRKPKEEVVSDAPSSSTTEGHSTHSAVPNVGTTRGGVATGSTGGIDACCAVLRAKSQSEKSPATRSNLAAAASACETQRAQLAQGKVSRHNALTAVRLSLLDTAPPACR